jgi:hypothetical protein
MPFTTVHTRAGFWLPAHRHQLNSIEVRLRVDPRTKIEKMTWVLTVQELAGALFATRPQVPFSGVSLRADTHENDLDMYRMLCQLVIRSDRIDPNDALNRDVGNVSASFAN